MIIYVQDNLWGEVLPSIDNDQLMKDCLQAEKYLLDNVIKDVNSNSYGSKTTASFDQYNLLTLPNETFQNLYHNIVSVIKPFIPDEPHMMQCWLNIFRGNEFIDWHSHWEKKYRTVHGYYCVNVTPSFTEYKFKHIPNQIFKVESKEGLLIFGKSYNTHRSSPWGNEERPRITIAFDIIPVSNISESVNHYIPF